MARGDGRRRNGAGDQRGQGLLDPRVAEVGQAAALAGNDTGTQPVVVGEGAEQLGGDLEILGRVDRKSVV